MNLKKFERRINHLEFQMRPSHHHTWIIYFQHNVMNHTFVVTREVAVAEVSQDYRSYYVMKPQYLSNVMVNYINDFARTNPRLRRKPVLKHYYILCSKLKGYRIQDWYYNDKHRIASMISSSRQHFLHKRFFLTKKELIHLEKYLLAKGVVKDSLIVQPVTRER